MTSRPAHRDFQQPLLQLPSADPIIYAVFPELTPVYNICYFFNAADRPDLLLA